MDDEQRVEFSGRLKRIGEVNRSGGGFEAAGTLGRTAKRKKSRRGRRLFRSAVRFVVLFTLFKVGLMAFEGVGTYASRVETMKAGNIGEKLGGLVMDVDPVSRIIAELAGELFG